jgi:hypothetical protein
MALTLLAPARATSSSKVKLHGYITGRVDDKVVLILDDRLETTAASRVVGQDSSSGWTGTNSLPKKSPLI